MHVCELSLLTSDVYFLKHKDTCTEWWSLFINSVWYGGLHNITRPISTFHINTLCPFFSCVLYTWHIPSGVLMKCLSVRRGTVLSDEYWPDSLRLTLLC